MPGMNAVGQTPVRENKRNAQKRSRNLTIAFKSRHPSALYASSMWRSTELEDHNGVVHHQPDSEHSPNKESAVIKNRTGVCKKMKCPRERPHARPEGDQFCRAQPLEEDYTTISQHDSDQKSLNVSFMTFRDSHAWYKADSHNRYLYSPERNRCILRH